jgi:peptide/nickel transport system permease protein
MSQSIFRAQQAASRRIQAGKNQDALGIIVEILKREFDNEQAWYMLSQVVLERDQKRYALRHVLRINPENAAAQAQIAEITGADGDGTEAAAVAALAVPPQTIPVEEKETGSISLVQWGQTIERPPLGVLEIDLLPGVKLSPWKRLRIRAGLVWRRFKLSWDVFSESRLAVIGLVIIFIFFLMAIAHPILIRTVWPRGIYDPITGFDGKVFPHPTPPSTSHIFGTDSLGRDVLSMLLAATTPTFVVGLTAAVTTAIIGTILSVLAAHLRGVVDMIITNLADVFLLIPAPIIMIIIGARFRDLGPFPLGLIYGVVTGTGATTIVLRAHALQINSMPYMEAARIAGGGPIHIIRKHLVPAMLPLAALQMMIAVTGAVVADGFISFFGLTRVSNNWGTMIFNAFVYGNISGSGVTLWNILLPTAASFSLFALGFYLVSRGLHRLASPRLRTK